MINTNALYEDINTIINTLDADAELYSAVLTEDGNIVFTLITDDYDTHEYLDTYLRNNPYLGSFADAYYEGYSQNNKDTISLWFNLS